MVAAILDLEILYTSSCFMPVYVIMVISYRLLLCVSEREIIRAEKEREIIRAENESNDKFE